MATEKMDIIVTLKDKFSKGIRAVGKSLVVVKTGVDRLKSAVFSLQGAFVALGTAMVARTFIQTAMVFEKYETVLKTIAGSAKKAKEAMAWVVEFTAKTPYELDQVTNAFVKLKSYGFDPTTGSLKILGDTAAGMGKSLMQAVEMFADAATGEFERIKEFGVKAKQQGDSVTFSWSQNGQQMVKTAKKTASAITKTLIDIFSAKYAGAMKGLSKTFEGMWSNIQDHFTQFQQAVMSADIFNYMKIGLAGVLNKINELKESGELDEWAKKASAAVIKSFWKMAFGVARVYDVFAPILKSFKNLFVEMWDWFKSLPPEVQKFGLVGFIMAGSWGAKLLVVMLAELASQITKAYKNTKDYNFAIRTTTDELERLKKSLPTQSEFSFWGLAESGLQQTTERIKELEKELIILTQLSEKSKDVSPIDPKKTEKNARTMVEIVAAAQKKMDALIAAAKPEEEVEKKPKPKVAVPKPTTPLAIQVQKELLVLEVLYKKGEEELIAYLEKRNALVLQALTIEIEALEKAAKVEKDPTKKLKIEDAIFIKKQQYALKEIELIAAIAKAREDTAAKRLEIEGMLKDLSVRANEELDSAQTAELAEMDARHAEELSIFKKELDDKLAAELGYIDEADAIRDISRQQQLEKDKLLSEQQKALWDKRLDFASESAGYLKDIFTDLYEIGDKKSKKMFKLMKNAAIAEAFINTAKAVTGALGTAPYGLAAIAMAALIALKGGVEVAKIKAQEMAGGGEVQGYSPHSKADNISIKGTAGEFMQPVAAVKHYGKKAMEGIRHLAFPKELFQGFSLPALAYARPSNQLALGGSVAGSQRSDFSVSVPVSISSERVANIAGTLQNEVEETVIRVMERELR